MAEMVGKICGMDSIHVALLLAIAALGIYLFLLDKN